MMTMALMATSALAAEVTEGQALDIAQRFVNAGAVKKKFSKSKKKKSRKCQIEQNKIYENVHGSKDFNKDLKKSKEKKKSQKLNKINDIKKLLKKKK